MIRPAFLITASRWLLLILVLLEPAAFYFLPYRDHPAAGDVYRNPTDKRAWPEYLRERAGARDRLVVLIGNSQAVGKEILDPGDIYFGLLKKQLSLGGYPVALENWSSGGLRTVDVELLSIQAIKRRAAQIIFVLSYRNVDHPFQLRLDYPSSDINLLAGDPFFWPYLRDTTFYPNTSLHDLLRRFFILHSNLLRLRIPIYDMLAAHLPSTVHRYVFGYRILPREQLDPTPRAPHVERVVDPRYLVEADEAEKLPITGPDMLLRLATFTRFLDSLELRFSGTGIKCSLAWMPLARSSMDDAGHARLQSFIEAANRAAGAKGMDTYDFTDLVPGSNFYTYSHMDAQGHRLLAEALLPIILNELQ